MADTTNFAWTKPTVGGDTGAWGTILNTLFDDVDSDLNTVKTTADAALPKSGGTMTGALELLTTKFAIVGLGNVFGTEVLDFSVANAWNGTVTANATFTLTNVPSGVCVGGLLRLVNGGSATITWPTEFKWAGGSAPVLTASGIDVVAFVQFVGSEFVAVAHLNVS